MKQVISKDSKNTIDYNEVSPEKFYGIYNCLIKGFITRENLGRGLYKAYAFGSRLTDGEQ